MAQIYGELIRAQLQVSASDLGSPAAGLIYFNSTTGAKWYSGSAWKTAVDLDSSQTLANKSLDATCSINSGILPVVPLTKGGLGEDASAWSGLVKISGGVASASSLALTDIPDTLITYAKLNLADGDIPQAKVSGLVTDLAGKLTGNAEITGETKTKITYDSKGLVTAGADLAAGDLPTGIDATKIADGSVDNTEFQKLGTAGTSGAGLLVTTDGLQSLSSKTLVEPVLDNFIDINEEAAPAAPGAGKLRVYAKSDSKIYKKDSTGAESEIGAGGSGTGRNYLQDWFDGTKPIGTIINGLTTTGNRSTSGGANLQWGASNTSNMTVTLETVTPLRQTSSIKIDSLNTTSGAFVETPMFLIDNADLGKPLSVEFDIGDIAANTNYDIVVMQYNLSGTYVQTIPVAGNASTGSPSSAQLPTGTTKFRGFFITAGDAGGYYYSLRIRKLAAVDDDFQIDSLFVGPQSLAQGAVVTAWQSYTPSLTSSGGGSITLNATGKVDPFGRWRRAGDSIEIEVGFANGNGGAATGNAGNILFSIPSGITIDSSKYTPTGSFGSTVGYGSYASGAGYGNGQSSVYVVASNSLSLIKGGSGTYYTVADLVSNATIILKIILPVSQWSSGTTTLADRAVEEYAWNSSATTTSDTTSFGNGPEGVNIRAFAPAGNNTVEKRVRFQTPILPTDRISLEINNGFGWGLASDILGGQATNDAGTASYGQFIRPVSGSNTDVSVFFCSLTNGLSAWSAVSLFKWRVRKVSSGAAVGFPVSARNIVGDTTGTAVPSGYVGESSFTGLTQRSGTGGLTYSARTTTAPGANSYAKVISITLNKGTYYISGFSACYSSSNTAMYTNLTIGGTTVTTDLECVITTTARGTNSISIPVVISSDSTEVALYSNIPGGTPQTARNELWAVRIA